MKRLFSLLFLGLSSLLFSEAMAQSAASTPAEQHYGKVAYLSGGIGEEERDEMRLRERDFNLKLLFAERSGAYLADVDVLLLNAKGETVLDAKSVGPFLLVQLASGRYGIKVSTNGQMQQGRLSIPAQGKSRGAFRW